MPKKVISIWNKDLKIKFSGKRLMLCGGTSEIMTFVDFEAKPVAEESDLLSTVRSFTIVN